MNLWGLGQILINFGWASATDGSGRLGLSLLLGVGGPRSTLAHPGWWVQGSERARKPRVRGAL